jgi:hypothetical protein
LGILEDAGLGAPAFVLEAAAARWAKMEYLPNLMALQIDAHANVGADGSVHCAG